MKKSRVEVRPATTAEIKDFFNGARLPTTKAWVGVLDGKSIGIGGLMKIMGRWFVFLDLKPEAREHKIALMRAARRVIKSAEEQGIANLYAIVDLKEKNSIAWLHSLEFERVTGTLFRWQN